MATLPNALIQYNGVIFPVETLTTGIAVKPVYDRANRTVTHRIYTIAIKSKVTAGVNQDITLAAIRLLLLTPGGAFQYQGRGFGGLEINVVPGERDLIWGPRPTLLTWAPHGAIAADIEWQVEVAKMDCGASHTGVMEWVYKATYDNDHLGYTKITHSGYIRIAQTRGEVGSAAINDSADNYYEDYLPERMRGYRREQIRRELSYDKCQLEYSFTDSRLTAPLPPGVGEASASHEFTNVKENNFALWEGSISAEYKTYLDFDRAKAWEYFLQLVVNRHKRDLGERRTIIPSKFTLAEPNIYGDQTAKFSMRYRLLPAGFKKGDKGSPFFFPTGSLWRPVSDSWDKWAASLDPIYPRGIDEKKFDTANDTIVDLCLNSSRSNGGLDAAMIGRLRKGDGDVPWDQVQRLFNIPETLSPLGSWISYECYMVVASQDHLTEHIPFPYTGGFSSPGSGWVPTDVRSSPNIVQQHAPRTYYVSLIGQATRMQYEIDCPQIESYLNQPVIHANREQEEFFTCGIAGYSTHPIYRAAWRQRWMVLRGESALGDVIKGEPPALPIEPPNVKGGKPAA